jgi:hypothetical protein
MKHILQGEDLYLHFFPCYSSFSKKFMNFLEPIYLQSINPQPPDVQIYTQNCILNLNIKFICITNDLYTHISHIVDVGFFPRGDRIETIVLGNTERGHSNGKKNFRALTLDIWQ